MRVSIRASRSAVRLLLTAAFFALSCSSTAPLRHREDPPARQILVTEGHVSLRTSAYVELHTFLAAAARRNVELESPLEPARRAYKRSLEGDDDDALLARTAQALSSCSDDRCAREAVASTGFGYAYERALPFFMARHWLERASAAWVGVEASQAALTGANGWDGWNGSPGEALLTRAGSELGVVWPDRPIAVDVVSESPPPGRAALISVALAARGSCFVRPRSAGRRVAGFDTNEETGNVQFARILDCIIVRALVEPSVRSPLRSLLVRELGRTDGERAYALVVVQTVAAVVTGWESRHVSVDRRSSAVAETHIAEWLLREWRGARSEPPEALGARLVATWLLSHPGARSGPK